MIERPRVSSIWSQDLNNREVRGRASDPARHIVGLETNDIAADFLRPQFHR